MTGPDGNPATAGHVPERVRGSEAGIEFTDMDRSGDPDQIRSRIALIRAHLAAAASLANAELLGTTQTYADQDNEVLEAQQGHGSPDVDGRGWAQ